MQKAAVEVGCTYTGEFELLLCSVNIATPLRIMRGLYADKRQGHTLHPRRDTFLWIFLGIGISSCVPENPQKKYSITIFRGSFFSAWASCEFFPCAFTWNQSGEFPTTRDNQTHSSFFSFMKCCNLVLTYSLRFSKARCFGHRHGL